MTAKPAQSDAQGAAPQSERREDILQVLEARILEAQHELAARSDAGEDVLDYLAHHGEPATRRAVAANIATPAKSNRHLADDEDEEVRAELARKIARLMPDLTAPEAQETLALTIETFERLAADQVPRVRAILAEEIKQLDCVPAQTVRALARDLEEIVAVPVLEYSPLLSDADLIEIIAEGKVHAALTAIARRKPVSPKVCDAITSSLDVSAVATLLANPDAKIRKRTLETIVDQAEKIGLWHEPLALRTDLSRRAVKRLASFVSTELLGQLAKRYNLREEVRQHLARQMRSRIEEKDEDSASASAAAQAEVEVAAAVGRLDENFIESAAESARREVLVLALSRLACLREEVVRRILLARSAKPVTALVWKAGLSMRAAFKIQRFVMRLPAHELLPAREGQFFPLTEDEMRWHLNYFSSAR